MSGSLKKGTKEKEKITKKQPTVHLYGDSELSPFMPCGRSSHMLSGVFPLPSSHLVEGSIGEKKKGFICEKR